MGGNGAGRKGLLRLAVILPALFLPSMAWAHAVLLDSSPADGVRMERPPAEIRLRFNEAVSPVTVRAFGPAGELALPGPTTVENDELRIPMPAVSPARGTYTVSYRVTSGDGHPVAGSLLFGVGVTPERPEQAGERKRDAALLVAALARALHYGSLLAAAGGALFVTLVAPGLILPAGRSRVPLVRRIRLPAQVGIAAAAVLLNLGLAGVVLTGGPPTALFDAESWRAALASTGGPSAGIALAGLTLLAAGLRGGWRAVTLAGALVAVGALAATGHAATAPPRGLAAPLVALHGLAAAYWLGSLMPLRAVLRHAPSAESARLVRRFSLGALAAVAVLLVAGAGLSLLQITSPAAIGTTVYGQLWLAKMVGVALLLGLASVNRLRLTPALRDGSRSERDRAQRLLMLSVASEMALMAVVLLLTAGLGTTPPPRALAQPVAEAAGYSSVATAKGRQAVIELDPARTGANRLTLHLAQADGTPFDPKELTMELTQPAAGIEPLARKPVRDGPGAYRLDGLALPVDGRWELRIDALIDDFEKAIFRSTLPVDK
ncbi:copper resistance CopC/CopD family protein [Azospirillum agricola]|uniref:copper resistance CopC/CopD family protein n=1 Tax=Azospirillum agricola TaxID=1720247 RepID=UPI000A0F3A09|nr:copper resistance protein CopC [Azospirillum agricola]SMH56742.1 copper transport protein [Azospirillum lipoferum]